MTQLINQIRQEISHYIRQNWINCQIHRPNDEETFIGLPKPFVAPCLKGQELCQEMFYWDSYFTGVGLTAQNRTDLLKNNVDNCLYCIDRFGFVPNATRTYMLTRSQPPYLTQMVKMVQKEEPDTHWLETAYPRLKKELLFWKSYPKLTRTGLSRYFDTGTGPNVENLLPEWASEAESGWDFTPRFAQQSRSVNPIDLNCNLYLYENDLADFSKMLGYSQAIESYLLDAENRKNKINDLCWCPKERFYFDFHFKENRRLGTKTLAAFHPLYAGIASKEQAAGVASHLPEFEQEYGLTTCDHNYGQTDKQWNWPNGWAPLHWIAVTGLYRYGYHSAADRIAEKFCRLVEKVYSETGKLWEKYNVIKGNLETTDERYPMFSLLGWTAGIYVGFSAESYKHAHAPNHASP